tara:strand:- start:1467 stop:2303 length:837 start_codon:yes stop_codon:yes gene_type:complete
LKNFSLDQETLNNKIKKLHKILKSYQSLIVAYSGGVDSAFLTAISHMIPGLKILAVTADSPSLFNDDLEYAKKLAREFHWNHIVIKTQEMNNASYVSNDAKRCFYCKTELYNHLGSIAKKHDFKYIANGANLDDLSDYRPGMKAAKNYNVVSPLVESGFNKNDIRVASRNLNLSTWDKPAQPCLASRIPYGTPVSIKYLNMIGFAEKKIRDLGFPVVRVRHFGDLAKIEIPTSDFIRFNSPIMKEGISKIIKDVGFKKMELDAEGYRSGSLNKKINKN